MKTDLDKKVLIDIVGDEIRLLYTIGDIKHLPVFVTKKSVDGLMELKKVLDNFGYDDPYGTARANQWIIEVMKEMKDGDKL